MKDVNRETTLERRRKNQAKWRAKYPQHARKVHLEYELNRRDKDPAYRLAHRLRSRMNRALKRGSKSASSEQLLGCSWTEFKEHLEQQFTFGMTWDNYGAYWHVDHIRPCASFDLTKPEEQRKCFHYTNLQPLLAAENLSKGSKILPESACISQRECDNPHHYGI